MIANLRKNRYTEDYCFMGSQESSQDVYNFGFSSQESLGEWSGLKFSSQESQEGYYRKPKKVKILDFVNSDKGCVGNSDSDPYGFNSLMESEEFKNVVEDSENGKKGVTVNDEENGVLLNKKKKKKKKGKKEKKGSKEVSALNIKTPAVAVTESLESGEMMEDVDELNFSVLDGLRKGQPVRIRRESLLSLLMICGTSQQRRLFRTHGLAKTIMNSILGLSFDDSPSNLAAATLFYILTDYGQDDRLVGSSNCIRFIIKLLKPVVHDSGNVKPPTIGSKLLSLHMDASCSQESLKGLDSTAHAIMNKVHDILVSCEEFKLEDGDGYRNLRPELDPKWISLLTVEKASLSKVSIEDISGISFKAGGNFKEKLRVLGGLDAIFEVARNCHNRMQGWFDQAKHKVDTGSLVLLLKCLKIMENATFLSKDNQSHLLEMKGNFDNRPSPRLFVKLLLSIIKILSDMSLRYLSDNTDDKNNCSHARRTTTCNKEDSAGILSLTSSVKTCALGGTSSQKITVDFQNREQSTSSQLNSQTSTSDYNSWSLKERLGHSTLGKCNTLLVNSKQGMLKGQNGSRKTFHSKNGEQVAESSKFNSMDASEDPFAFDDDVVPSKWDFVSGTKKTPLSQSSSEVVGGEAEDGPLSPQILSQQESSGMVASSSATADQKTSSLVTECLLTAVKALMNLTNDNPPGCQQIAANGGLVTLSSLITDHFSSFTSCIPVFNKSREGSGSLKSSCDVNLQNDKHLADQELDFLVAILGLLVNLVEKDGHNRSRLASANCGDLIPLLCSIFLANQGSAEMAEEGRCFSWDDSDAISQGEKEAEKMIIEAYAALLLAFLSTESKSIRDAIAECFPDRSLSILVPVLERFAEFHFTLNMISRETYTTVLEVIESCRIP